MFRPVYGLWKDSAALVRCWDRDLERLNFNNCCDVLLHTSIQLYRPLIISLNQLKTDLPIQISVTPRGCRPVCRSQMDALDWEECLHSQFLPSWFPRRALNLLKPKSLVFMMQRTLFLNLFYIFGLLKMTPYLLHFLRSGLFWDWPVVLADGVA